MRCQYCNKRLSVFKLLGGQPFCSKEHRDLFNASQQNDAINRLISSFSEEPETKQWPVPKAPEAGPVSDAPPAPTAASVEAPVEAPAKAVVPVEENDPHETSFLPQIRPAPKSPPVVLKSRIVTQTPAGEVRFPSSAGPEALKLDQPLVEQPSAEEPVETPEEPPLAELAGLDFRLTPAGTPATAPVSGGPAGPEQKTPSIVSAPANRDVVLQEPGLVPLPVGSGRTSGAPFFVLEPQDVALQPGPVALEPAQSTPVPSEPAGEFAPPPPAAARALGPEIQRPATTPAALAAVSSLRPRTVALQAPGVEPEEKAVLAPASVVLYPTPLQLVSQAPGMEASSALPAAAFALRSPGPAQATSEFRSLSALAFLLPLRLPAPVVGAAATREFAGSTWRLAVEVPRLPVLRVRTVSSIGRLADSAALRTVTVAGQSPIWKPLPEIACELPVRVPVEKLPPASLPSLPLSAQALPGAKPSTHQLPTPAASFAPSVPKSAWRVRLPETTAPVWRSALLSAGSMALAQPPGLGNARLAIVGLEQEMGSSLQLPRFYVALAVLTPAASSATFDISHRPATAPVSAGSPDASIVSGITLQYDALFTIPASAAPSVAVCPVTFDVARWAATSPISGGNTAAPIATDITLRFSAPLAILPSNALAAATVALSVEPPASPKLAYLHESLRVGPAGSERASVNPLTFHFGSGMASFRLRSSSNIRPLWSDASLVHAGWRGQPQTSQLSNLTATRPSPLSLMMAPEAMPTPALRRKLDGAERPVLVPWSALYGSTVAAQLASPTVSLRRVALPAANGPVVSFELLSWTAPSPLAAGPFLPRRSCADQVRIAASRIEPASMPVLPDLAQAGSIYPAAALAAARNRSESPQSEAGTPSQAPVAGWLVRTPIVAKLPWTTPPAYSPAMRLAPANERLSLRSVTPAAHAQTMRALSSRQRIARAFTSGLRSFFPLHF